MEYTDTAPDTSSVHVPVQNLPIKINDSYIDEYPKEVLDLFEKWFNEISNPYVVSPGTAFEKLQDHYSDEYSFLRSRFTSEVGEDGFYVLYAHFLNRKTGINSFTQEREDILKMFHYINEINRQLQYGGTFFGHQELRIYGHAEYALYKYSNNDWLVKKYSIEKQKKLFLDGIRQRILDEESYDFETLGDAKISRRKELFVLIDKIDKLITNFFYLTVAREFQYTNYI